MTTADKLNMVVWAFSFFSVLILLLIALSWYRKKRLSLFNKAAILIVLAGVASVVDAYWIEPNWLQTEQVVIHDPELAQVLKDIKVVQISDIHLQGGQISNLSPLERDLITQVNALKPDLLFITGDFFSDKQTWELAAEVKALSELIRSFKTTTGIFGVPGNEVNLLLVGHTHGGQIGISFLAEKSNSAKKSSFMRGLFDAGKTKMYVNRGIATTHIPIRFFNRPEITVFAIRK